MKNDSPCCDICAFDPRNKWCLWHAAAGLAEAFKAMIVVVLKQSSPSPDRCARLGY